jgi:cysteine desulfurase
MKKIFYFDYAATTPIDRRVFEKMRPYFLEDFGNPSNLYVLGRRAKRVMAEAGKEITMALNCAEKEFVFTGSATEADNLALAGVARANKSSGNRIVVSAVEHKGILSVAHALEAEGFEIVEVPVRADGLIDLESLKKAINGKTIVVSVTYADSETGTVQPIREISRLVSELRKKNGSRTPYFHTDASQAAAYEELDVEKLGVDLMTLSAHKLYGPKGIGGLYVRRGTPIKPIIYGGGQQGSLRSGTENVQAIVGFGEAMRIVSKEKKKEAKQLALLRDRLEKGIFGKIPKVVLNGHPKMRLPNFLNVSVLDVEGEAMLLYLDREGIMVGTGSACNSESLEPSYILSALGNPYEYIHGSIRFTLGRYTKSADVGHVLRILPEIVTALRRVSPLNLKMNRKEMIAQPRAFVGGQTPHFLRKKSK